MKTQKIAACFYLALCGLACFAAVTHAAATTHAASDKDAMHMPVAEESANFKPTRQAFTADHRFLVKLLSLPSPIPFEQYFQLRFAIYDGHHPTRQITDATMRIVCRHAARSGARFRPRHADLAAASNPGMAFHRVGNVLSHAGSLGGELTVQEGGKQGTAYFRFPCCGR